MWNRLSLCKLSSRSRDWKCNLPEKFELFFWQDGTNEKYQFTALYAHFYGTGHLWPDTVNELIQVTPTSARNEALGNGICQMLLGLSWFLFDYWLFDYVCFIDCTHIELNFPIVMQSIQPMLVKVMLKVCITSVCEVHQLCVRWSMSACVHVLTRINMNIWRLDITIILKKNTKKKNSDTQLHCSGKCV